MVGLETWRVEGPELPALEARLKTEPGVEQVARFGAVLHISGTEQAAAQRDGRAAEGRRTHRWSLQVAGLEEAFIYLMAGARDNFATDTAKSSRHERILVPPLRRRAVQGIHPDAARPHHLRR